MFPIYDASGHVVGFGGRVLGDGEPKYLNSAESEVFAKRTPAVRAELGQAGDSKSRPPDHRRGLLRRRFACTLAGIAEVVAPLGTALTEQQAALIRKYTKNVFLLYDSDQAGLKATFRAGDELLRAGVVRARHHAARGRRSRTRSSPRRAPRVSSAPPPRRSIVFDRKIQILERGGWFADLRRKRQALDKLLPTIRATSDRLTARSLRRAHERGRRRLRASMLIGASSTRRRRARRDARRRRTARPRRRRRGREPAPAPRAAPSPHRRAARRARARPSAPASAPVRRGGRRTRRSGAFARFDLPRDLRAPDGARARTPRSTSWRLTLDEEAIEVMQQLLEETGGLDRVGRKRSTRASTLCPPRDIGARMTEIDRFLPLAGADEKDELDPREDAGWQPNCRRLGRPRWKTFTHDASGYLLILPTTISPPLEDSCTQTLAHCWPCRTTTSPFANSKTSWPSWGRGSTRWRRSATTRVAQLEQATQTRRSGGAPATRSRGARRAAPRAAGEESGGAEHRDFDARGDRGDGAARAGQADDRRRRTRARRHRPAARRSANRWPTTATRIAADLETGAGGGARVARRRISRAIEAQIGDGARSPRTRRRAAVPRSAALEVRSHSIAQAGARGVSAARPVVRELRHDDSAAATQLDDGNGGDGDLRRLRRDAVRGGLMIVGGGERHLTFRA